MGGGQSKKDMTLKIKDCFIWWNPSRSILTISPAMYSKIEDMEDLSDDWFTENGF